VARTTPESWGANLPGSPIVAADDPEDRMTIFLVPAGQLVRVLRKIRKCVGIIVLLFFCLCYGFDNSKIDYYFGNIDDRRVVWSMGRDLMMQPAQDDGPVNRWVLRYLRPLSRRAACCGELQDRAGPALGKASHLRVLRNSEVFQIGLSGQH
jgi:hypothetical protein